MNIKCEICGSNEIIKKNDAFVCQVCGIMYTKDEIIKLMNNSASQPTDDPVISKTINVPPSVVTQPQTADAAASVPNDEPVLSQTINVPPPVITPLRAANGAVSTPTGQQPEQTDEPVISQSINVPPPFVTHAATNGDACEPNNSAPNDFSAQMNRQAPAVPRGYIPTSLTAPSVPPDISGLLTKNVTNRRHDLVVNTLIPEPLPETMISPVVGTAVSLIACIILFMVGGTASKTGIETAKNEAAADISSSQETVTVAEVQKAEVDQIETMPQVSDEYTSEPAEQSADDQDAVFTTSPDIPPPALETTAKTTTSVTTTPEPIKTTTSKTTTAATTTAKLISVPVEPTLKYNSPIRIMQIDIRDDRMHWRIGPGKKYERVNEGGVARGEILPIYGEETDENGDKWGYTYRGGKYGWIMEKYMVDYDPKTSKYKIIVVPEVYCDDPFEFTVLVNGLRLRKGPSSSAEVMCEISKGTRLAELGFNQNDNGKWVYTQYKGQIGWVMAYNGYGRDDPDYEKYVRFDS